MKMRVWVSCLLLAAAAGCSSDKLRLQIESDPQTNNARSLYVVVSQVDERRYVTESYEAVAGRVFKAPPDPMVLKASPVLPGHDLEIEVDKPADDKAVAIYFLFTKPGPRWKTFLEGPLPDEVEFKLEGSQIAEQD